jgi:hypothetical protein
MIMFSRLTIRCVASARGSASINNLEMKNKLHDTGSFLKVDRYSSGQECPCFYGTWRFIAAFTKSRYRTLLRVILALFAYLCLVLSCTSLQIFGLKCCVYFSCLLISIYWCYVTRIDLILYLRCLQTFHYRGPYWLFISLSRAAEKS